MCSRSRTCLPDAAVADVGERPPEVVVQQPEREHPLVDACPSATGPAITPQRSITVAQPEVGRVLGDQQLGGELGRPVERPRARRAESARRSRPPRRPRAAARRRARSGSRPRSRRSAESARYGIDAAGREEDELGPVAARELEAVVGADEVGLERIGGIAGHPDQRRGLGRALDQRVDRLERRAARRGRARRRARTRTPAASSRGRLSSEPRPVEVVERDQLPVGMAVGERHAEVGADEPGPPGDQHAPHDR